MRQKRNLHQQKWREYFEGFAEPVTESGCWLWLGPTNKMKNDERGRIMICGKRDLAHRWAFRIYKGGIPDGLQINHKCDIPSCVNPDHLYAGTSKENAKDRDSRNRRIIKLTAIQASQIRKSNNKGKELAAQYGVSEALISGIRNRKIWRERANG